VCYPGILATVKRKLEQLALRQKRECSWSALIGCNPTARVARRPCRQSGTGMTRPGEENVHCAKSRRQSVALEGFMPIKRPTNK
jgi:hypothetical protein